MRPTLASRCSVHVTRPEIGRDPPEPGPAGVGVAYDLFDRGTDALIDDGDLLRCPRPVAQPREAPRE